LSRERSRQTSVIFTFTLTGKVVTVGSLGTLCSKFEFQKQTLAELAKGAAAAAIASKSAGLAEPS